MRNCTIFVIVAAVGLGALMGCQAGQVTRISPQSHFDYPNSNVKPLGPVKVKISGRGGWMFPPMPTGADELKLYNAALAQVDGANMLINYVQTAKLYNLWILPVWWSELELEGEAAKMEVGQQALR